MPHMSCTTYCPKAIAPTYASAGLKRAVARLADAHDGGAVPFPARTCGLLAVAVVVHLATIVYAMRGGLTAGEILARTQGNVAFLVFYVVFLLAVAIHAPIGPVLMCCAKEIGTKLPRSPFGLRP
jgi:hypothetical protein